MKRFLLFTSVAIVAGFIFSLPHAHAAPLFVSSSSFGATAAATSVSTTLSVTANNLVVAGCRAGTTFVAPNNVTDTIGNVFTQFSIASDSNDGSLTGYFAISSGTNASDVIRCNFASSRSFRNITAASYSGVATSSPLDTTSTAGTATTSKIFSSGTFSTGNAKDLIWTEGQNGTGNSMSAISGGYNIRSNLDNVFIGVADADLAVSTIQTSQSIQWTTSASSSWMVIVGAFKAAPYTPASFTYYRTLTVTSTQSLASGTNANFPFLVSSTLSSWKASSTGGTVQNLCTDPNGNTEPCDLVFATSSANCTAGNYLNFETEKYSSSTGAVVDWVDVPSVSTSTVIYACYDASTLTADQSDPQSTWNANYLAVYHMGQATSTLNLYNSTLSSYNINSLTAGVNAVSATSSAPIDGGMAITATTSIKTAVSSVAASTSISLEGWFNGAASGANQSLFWYGTNIGGAGSVYGLDYSNGHVFCSNRAGATINTAPTGTVSYVCTFASSTIQTAIIYANGVAGASATSSLGYANGGNNIVQINNAGTFTGVVDEVRVGPYVETPQWILTEYSNYSAPDDAQFANGFYHMGTETAFNGNTSLPAVTSTIFVVKGSQVRIQSVFLNIL